MSDRPLMTRLYRAVFTWETQNQLSNWLLLWLPQPLSSFSQIGKWMNCFERRGVSSFDLYKTATEFI